MTSTEQDAVDALDPRLHYSHNTPAWRDDRGRWIDPDTLEPATYDVPEGAPEGMDGWRVTDLRRFRDEGPDGPVLPYEHPERVRSREEALAEHEAREEEARAKQAEWQAGALTSPPSNVDLSGRPHFLYNIDGREVCGQDGEPWPCRTWLDDIEPAVIEESLGLTPAETAMVDAYATPDAERIRQAAALLGMSPQEIGDMLQRDASADR